VLIHFNLPVVFNECSSELFPCNHFAIPTASFTHQPCPAVKTSVRLGLHTAKLSCTVILQFATAPSLPSFSSTDLPPGAPRMRQLQIEPAAHETFSCIPIYLSSLPTVPTDRGRGDHRAEADALRLDSSRGLNGHAMPPFLITGHKLRILLLLSCTAGLATGFKGLVLPKRGLRMQRFSTHMQEKRPTVKVPFDFSLPDPKPLTATGDLPGLLTASSALALRFGAGITVAGWSPQLSLQPPPRGEYALKLGPVYLSDTSAVTRGECPRPTGRLVLYEFDSSPYCRKVRDACTALDLEVEYRPCPGALPGGKFSDELYARTGRRTVPYLIDEGLNVEMFGRSIDAAPHGTLRILCMSLKAHPRAMPQSPTISSTTCTKTTGHQRAPRFLPKRASTC
jgi:hypothetical protein